MGGGGEVPKILKTAVTYFMNSPEVRIKATEFGPETSSFFRCFFIRHLSVDRDHFNQCHFQTLV